MYFTTSTPLPRPLLLVVHESTMDLLLFVGSRTPACSPSVDSRESSMDLLLSVGFRTERLSEFTVWLALGIVCVGADIDL